MPWGRGWNVTTSKLGIADGIWIANLRSLKNRSVKRSLRRIKNAYSKLLLLVFT